MDTATEMTERLMKGLSLAMEIQEEIQKAAEDLFPKPHNGAETVGDLLNRVARLEKVAKDLYCLGHRSRAALRLIGDQTLRQQQTQEDLEARLTRLELKMSKVREPSRIDIP